MVVCVAAYSKEVVGVLLVGALRGGEELVARGILLGGVSGRRSGGLFPRACSCLGVCECGVFGLQRVAELLPLVVLQRDALAAGALHGWEGVVSERGLLVVKHAVACVVEVGVLFADALECAQDRRVDVWRDLLAVLVLGDVRLRVRLGRGVGVVAVLFAQLLELYTPLVVLVPLRVRLVHAERVVRRLDDVGEQVHGGVERALGRSAGKKF